MFSGGVGMVLLMDLRQSESVRHQKNPSSALIQHTAFLCLQMFFFFNLSGFCLYNLAANLFNPNLPGQTQRLKKITAKMDSLEMSF